MTIRVFSALAVWLAVLIAGGIVFLRALDPDARTHVSVIGQLPDLRLPALPPEEDGWTSEMLRGEISLINVFASWCVPCVYEHPQMTALQHAGFDIYGILYKDNGTDARKWLNRHGNPYRAIGVDPNGSIGIELGISGVPETFVIDSQGKIRYHHAGPLDPEDMENTVMPLLDSLLDSQLDPQVDSLLDPQVDSLGNDANHPS